MYFRDLPTPRLCDHFQGRSGYLMSYAIHIRRHQRRGQGWGFMIIDIYFLQINDPEGIKCL